MNKEQYLIKIEIMVEEIICKKCKLTQEDGKNCSDCNTFYKMRDLLYDVDLASCLKDSGV